MNNQALAAPQPGESLTRLIGTPLPAGYGHFGPQPEPAASNLGEIWSAIVRNRWLIALIILTALGIGAASIMLTKPVYRAETTIQIEPQSLRILGTEEVAPDATRAEAERALKTQVDILRSRATAQGVARKLNLASNPEFLRDSGIDPTGLSPADLSRQVTNALHQRLDVKLPPDSRVIRLSFESHDPVIAAAVVNGFAETFIEGSLQRRLDTYAYSRSFLQRQLKETKARLEASERALNQYARSAGLVDASSAAGSAGTDGQRRSLTTASLVDLNAAYSQARANRVQAQQRWQQALSTPTMSLPEVLSNPAIQKLSERRAELQSAFEEERQRRKDEHPAIQQAEARIREMDRQIASIAAGIRNSIGEAYRVAQRQESALHANVGQLKSAAFGEQDKEVRYNILKREADTNRNLFNRLLQRFNEISSQAADTNNTISIVDRALPPASASSPRPAFNMTIAALAGILLALIVVLGRNRIDDRVHGPARIEQEFGVPLIGVVPLLKEPQHFRNALLDSRSELAEAHQAIALSLDSLASAPEGVVIMLTSSRAEEGKSTTALKLGATFAASGKRVLVIDGDMRRGSLNVLLETSGEAGLADFLAAGPGTRLEAWIEHSEEFGFDFLGRGRPTANPAELLSGPRLAELLSEARAKYDVVIIDGPPVIGLADAPRLAGMADATLFVLEAGRAAKSHVKAALRRLAGARADQIGIILSKYDRSKDVGNYGYAYCYEYSADNVHLIPDGRARSGQTAPVPA